MNPYEESIRRTDARLGRELFLGRGTRTGCLRYAKPDEYLGTHMHLIGASNFGKSFYLEHLLRDYTELRIPASIIDPHGDHARHYYEFLLQNPRLKRERRIVHFTPGSESNGRGFDPFRCGLADPAEVASLVLEAFFKVWGERSFNETPRLERVLRNMFHVFASNGLPLTESYQFLLVGNRPFRQNLLARVADERVRANWQELEELPRSEKLDRFESSWNRLQRFLAIPAVANLFAANGNSLDFTELFNRGEILVADLARLHSTEAQSLVGTMMVNALHHAAKRRPQPRRSPWVLAIDEFPSFVTSDIARNLDQLRKFGIRLILAHQRLAQLPDDLASAVLTNARIRAVFGGLSRQDAEILARELFTGEVRGERVKHIAYQTKFRPRLTQRPVETFSESSTDGESETHGWAEGASYGFGDTEGESRAQGMGGDETDETVTHSLSTSYSSSDSFNSSGSRSASRAETQGRSVSFPWVTEHQEFIEETSRQFCPLEEQWERLIARVMNLDCREALVKVCNRPVLDITTPEIRRTPPRRWRHRRHRPAQTPANGAETANDGMKPRGREGDLPPDFRE